MNRKSLLFALLSVTFLAIGWQSGRVLPLVAAAGFAVVATLAAFRVRSARRADNRGPA